MPTMQYYFMQHPELFQRDFTSTELATIAISAVITAALIIAIIFYLNRSL